MIYPSSKNLIILCAFLASLALAADDDESYTITTSYPSRRFTSNGQMAAMVGIQAFYWIPALLLLIVGCSVCFMMDMDKDKHKDTLLYAKFLTNVKDK